VPTYKHGELLTAQISEGEFWLDPYIPKQSTTFMWGDTSIGKSPVTWKMALAVASGKSFFGLPTRPAKVLYLEVDTAAVVNVPRIQKTQGALEGWEDNLLWCFDESFQVPTDETRARLLALRALHEPDVVFVNTLRKVHAMDDKDSKTPSTVYNFLGKQVFPNSSIILVHHERKRSTDPNARRQEDESYSGSKAWANDATVGLHLQKFRSPHGKANLRLVHWKSQASELVKQLELSLSDDGTNLSCHYFDEYLRVYEALNEDSGSTERRKFDRAMGEELGISAVVARRRRLDIENGLWPKTRRWLGRAQKGKKHNPEEPGDAEAAEEG